MTFGQMFFCQMFFDQMTWNTAHLSEAMQTFQEISAQWYKLLQKNVCTGIYAVMYSRLGIFCPVANFMTFSKNNLTYFML